MSELGAIIGDNQSNLDVDTQAQIGMFGNLSYFEMPRETIYVDSVSIRADKVYPDLGSTFILGHDTASVLGTDRLGFVISSTTRAIESKFYEDFSETFSATTYKDTANTSAVGWGTGSILFSTGSVIQSLNIGSDISLNTTNIDRVKMSVSGTKTYLTVGSMTTDGTNWFGIDYDIWRQFTTGSTGSNIRWKIIGSETLQIDQVDIIYKQDDV